MLYVSFSFGCICKASKASAELWSGNVVRVASPDAQLPFLQVAILPSLVVVETVTERVDHTFPLAGFGVRDLLVLCVGLLQGNKAFVEAFAACKRLAGPGSVFVICCLGTKLPSNILGNSGS